MNLEQIERSIRAQSDALNALIDNDTSLTLSARARLLSLAIHNFLTKTSVAAGRLQRKTFFTNRTKGDTDKEWMTYNRQASLDYEKLFGGRILNMRRELSAAGIPESELWDDWMQTSNIGGSEIASKIEAASIQLRSRGR